MITRLLSLKPRSVFPFQSFRFLSEEIVLETPDEPPLEDQLADTQEKYLRCLASMENLRKQTEKELQNVRMYGVSTFVKSLLPVIDNLGLALENADPKSGSLYEGVEMTHRDFLKTLGSFGVKQIETSIGDEFDPKIHNALCELQADNLDPGSIGLIVKTGYVIRDRVLRPSEVGVIKK